MKRITSTVYKRKHFPVDLKCQKTAPLLCIVGFSSAGKTTVTIGLVAALKQRGLHVGTIKHDVHDFEMDRPGKDSWRHKQAGASTTIISSPAQIGMVMDVDHDHHPLELVPLLGEMDIVLVEGFKQADLPKIEVFRPENDKPPACRNDRNLLAVVSDSHLDWGVPRYAANDFEGLAELILEHFRLVPVIDRGCHQTACG
jgi:molybdopterin-guanine dinucleotide biosynthesis adapter protein